jgi:hypothetical protein
VATLLQNRGWIRSPIVAKIVEMVVGDERSVLNMAETLEELLGAMADETALVANSVLRIGKALAMKCDRNSVLKLSKKSPIASIF